MKELPCLTNLIDALSSFPSIGRKTAERMAFSILSMDEEKVESILKAIKDAKEKIHQCENCGALIDTTLCPYCNDSRRNHDTCIVLSYPKDVFIFDKVDEYHGQYHVLNGEISSSKGVGIDDLRINELQNRVENEGIKELILATNSTIEGEITAMYISKIFEDNKDLKVTRLARGLPMGGNIEYSDSLTLIKALENRTDIK